MDDEYERSVAKAKEELKQRRLQEQAEKAAAASEVYACNIQSYIII